MSSVPPQRVRSREILWLAAFAAGNFVAAHAPGAEPSRIPDVGGHDAPTVVAVSGHARPLPHRE